MWIYGTDDQEGILTEGDSSESEEGKQNSHNHYLTLNKLLNVDICYPTYKYFHILKSLWNVTLHFL